MAYINKILIKAEAMLESRLVKIIAACAIGLALLVAVGNGLIPLYDRFVQSKISPSLTPTLIRSHMRTTTMNAPVYDLPPLKNVTKYRAIPVKIRLFNPSSNTISFFNFKFYMTSTNPSETYGSVSGCPSSRERACFKEYKVKDNAIEAGDSFNTPILLESKQVMDVDILFATWLLVFENKKYIDDLQEQLQEQLPEDKRKKRTLKTFKEMHDINKIVSFPYYYMSWEDQDGQIYYSSIIDDSFGINLMKDINKNKHKE